MSKEFIGLHTLKHGFAKQGNKTRLYRIWENMKRRCNNPEHPSFKDYGGRGIKICDQWDNFLEFYNDMNDSYEKHIEKYGIKETSIDRIDVNGNYEPSNCRWATGAEQANNTRMNRLIEYNGETHNITEWSRIVGISMNTLRSRIVDNHWPIHEALTLPVGSSPTHRVD